jgi:hypothetical protein
MFFEMFFEIFLKKILKQFPQKQFQKYASVTHVILFAPCLNIFLNEFHQFKILLKKVINVKILFNWKENGAHLI